MSVAAVLTRLGGMLPMSVNRMITPQGMAPSVSSVLQVRTFKDVDVLAKRCKDCYFTKDDYRWYVLCKKFGRHKQRQKLPDKRSFWIVTHSTHGPRKRF